MCSVHPQPPTCDRPESYTRSSRAGTGSQMCGNLEAVEMLSGEKMPHIYVYILGIHAGMYIFAKIAWSLDAPSCRKKKFGSLGFLADTQFFKEIRY